MRSPVAREVRWPVVSGPLDFCGGEVAGEDGKGGGGGGECPSDTTSVTLRRLDVGATSPTSYRLLSLIKPID